MTDISQDKPTEQATPVSKKMGDKIAKDDPHKVEKLTNAGKDTDVAEEAEQE